jgi:CRP-like cAMP-binding protein
MSRINQVTALCTTCATCHLCVPQGLGDEDTMQLQAIITITRTVRRGETLFRTDDTFDSLYAIRSGSVKTTVTHFSGREQVMGLHLSATRSASMASASAATRATRSRWRIAPSVCFPSRDSSGSAARPSPSSGVCSRS